MKMHLISSHIAMLESACSAKNYPFVGYIATLLHLDRKELGL